MRFHIITIFDVHKFSSILSLLIFYFINLFFLFCPFVISVVNKTSFLVLKIYFIYCHLMIARCEPRK